MSDETTTIDGIAHEQLTERRTTSGSDDVSERQICSVCCRQQPDAYGYDEYRSEDWPCPAVQKKRFHAAYGAAVAELSEQRQENARLRERVAALEGGVMNAHYALAAHTCDDSARWAMQFLDLLSVGREAEMPADMRCDCNDAALAQADETGGGAR